MFDIYIKDFNQNGKLVTTETLVQSIPSATQSELKLISPTVKAEMGNAEQFNFSIEGGTKFYDAFNQMKTFMRVVYDGDTIFYGRVLTIENSFTGNRKLRLEGPLAFLNDTSIEGQKEEGRENISVNAYLSKIIDNHNTMCGDSKRSFNLGEVPGNYHSASSEQQIQNAERKFGQDGWTDSKGAIEDLRSHYGGYLRVRCNGHKNSNGTYSDDGHYLDWLNHYFNTSENSQAIEVGKNVIDISTSTEIDNIFTVVIPIGNSKSTSYETADGEKKASGPKHFYVDGIEVIVPSVCSVYGNALNSGYHTYDDYAQALNRYGRIVKTVTFDDAETPAELLTKCHEWIKNNYQGEVTKFTVKAVDMHQIGDTSISKIMVGDRVRIIYPIVKEDGSVEKAQLVRTCLSINYDLYNPENNSYTFGIPANILTKSYGVTKQGKSTKDASTTPKSGGGGGGNSKTVDWLDKVTEWLARHKIYYKHKPDGSIDTDVYPTTGTRKFPYKEEYASYMKGDRNDRFYVTEVVGGVGRFKLWTFTPDNTTESTFNQDELDKILKQVEDGMQGALEGDINYAKSYAEKAYRDSCVSKKYYKSQITLNGILSHEQIVEGKIIEYVKEEYGIDLTTFEGVSMPPLTYTDVNGVKHTVEAGKQPGTVVTTEMIKTGKSDDPSFHIVFKQGPNGETVRVGSIVNPDTGEWEYFVVDPEDPTKTVRTSIRKLEWLEADGVKFRGSLIQGDWTDEDGNPHIYKFGQEIENWADGEMVVAHVDGDVIKIGSRVTRYSSNVATRINGTWLHPTEYVVDSRGKVNAILIGDTGQGSMEAYWDQTLNNGAGGYRALPDIWDDMTPSEQDAWLASKGLTRADIVYLTGDGYWDTSNLAIGDAVYTTKDPSSGKTVTYLSADVTVVGTPTKPGKMLSVLESLVNAGVITAEEGYNPVSQALVAQTIYVKDMNGVNAHFHTIETDYLKTSYLKSEISKLDLVNVQAIASANDYPNAYARLDSFYGNHHYFNVPGGGGSVTYKDLRYAIDYIYITSSGATSTVHLHTFMEGELSKSNKPGYVPNDIWDSLTFKNYTGGWDACRNSVISKTYQIIGSSHNYDYFPTSEVPSTYLLTYFKVGQPSSTVDGSIDPMTYHLDGMSDNNTVYLRYNNQATGNIVARVIHNKYNSGWSAARNSVTSKTYQISGSSHSYDYFPTSEVPSTYLLTSFKVGKPNSTVDGSIDPMTYYLDGTSNNNTVYLRYNNPTTGNIVARVIHNKYNSGWDYCADNKITIVWPESGTYTSGTITVSAAVTKSNNKSVSLGNRTYTIKGQSYDSAIKMYYWYSEWWIDPDGVNREHQVWYTYTTTHPQEDYGYDLKYNKNDKIYWNTSYY